MLNLSLLTRNFHDQLCEKVILNNNNILSVYIYAFEIGNKYYDDGKSNTLSFNADGFDVEYIDE